MMMVVIMMSFIFNQSINNFRLMAV